MTVLGDQTAAGPARGLVLQAPDRVSGAVEAPADDVSALAALLPGIDVLPADPEPGSALHRWLDGAPTPAGVVHLAGHVPSISTLRARLRAAGLDRRSVKPHAYWAPGKAGL